MELAKSNFEAKVVALVKEHFKDQSVAEIELTENVLERLSKWAKLFASIVAVPLAIGLAVLGYLGFQGYSTLQNFQNTLSSRSDQLRSITNDLNKTENLMHDISQRTRQYAALGGDVTAISKSLYEFTARGEVILDTKKQGNALGVDISEYDETADLKILKDNGMSFVFVVATRGTHCWSSFHPHWDASKSLDFVRGAIHDGNFEDPRAQADNFVTYVKPEKDDLLILRLEAASPSEGISMPIDHAVVFCQQVVSDGYRRPILYMNVSVLESLTEEQKQVLKEYPIWIANQRAMKTDSINVKPWNKWTFWQVSSAVPVAGKGLFGYNVFDGTPDDLEQFQKNSR